MVTQNRLPQIAAFLVSALLILSLTAAAQKKSPENRNTEPTAQVAPKPETPETTEHEDPMFKGMKYRLVGPFRGGRSLTASGIPGDPTTYYFGATGGGVWKSTDGALTWKPVFEKENSPAIGSLAVAVSNPNVVYVGTGEACLRGNIAQGDGVYKTLDGGKTWKNVGLRDSRAIGKVIVNPTNPDIAFVAALGHPYGPNHRARHFSHDRRRQDVGQGSLQGREHRRGRRRVRSAQSEYSLRRALAGAARAVEPSQRRARAAGSYRSNDGGTTWKRSRGERGLPKGPYGRIGVSVAANSDRVYALIEAAEGGLYARMTAAIPGNCVNGSHSLLQRPGITCTSLPTRRIATRST